MTQVILYKWRHYIFTPSAFYTASRRIALYRDIITAAKASSATALVCSRRDTTAWPSNEIAERHIFIFTVDDGRTMMIAAYFAARCRTYKQIIVPPL